MTVIDAALIKEHAEDTLAWHNNDNAAYSTIMLHITSSMQQLIIIQKMPGICLQHP